MKTIFGKLMKYFGTSTPKWSSLVAAPFIFFRADESNNPTLCGDSWSRDFILRYLLEENGRGNLIQKLGMSGGHETIGFLADSGVVSGWLDTTDGFFKINVPNEALNQEKAHVAYTDFQLNRCFGLRVDCSTNPITAVIAPNHGVLIYNHVAQNGTWIWCPINQQTGMFRRGETIRASVPIQTHLPDGTPLQGQSGYGGYMAPMVLWKNNQFICDTAWARLESCNNQRLFTHYVDTWTPNADGSLSHTSNTYVCTCVTIEGGYKRIDCGGLPAVNLEASVKFDDAIIESHWHWHGDWLITTRIGMTDHWEYTCEDLGCDEMGGVQHNREYFLVGLYTMSDPEDEEYYYTKGDLVLIRKSDGAIVNRFNVFDDTAVPPTGVARTHGDVYAGFVGGIPVLHYHDASDHRNKITDLRTGQVLNGVAYRDYFRYGYAPVSFWGADKTMIWSGTISTQYQGHGLTGVPVGNCFHLSLSDNSIIISESTITDQSTSCPADHYKAKCSYKIVRKGNHAPVKDAQVLIKVVAEEILGSVKFEYTWTAITDLQGMVYAEMPDCVPGVNYLDFRICFEALDVIPPDLDENGTPVEWFYAPAQNEAEEKLCVTHPATSLCCGMTPPKGTMSSVSAPYNYGGVWYSIMTCQSWSNPAAGRKPDNTCGCTQYRFVCQEDDTKSTGWRDIYNLAGQIDPTGAQVVPTTYWWVNPSKLRYHWAVQYRPCQCEQIGEQSDWMAG